MSKTKKLTSLRQSGQDPRIIALGKEGATYYKGLDQAVAEFEPGEIDLVVLRRGEIEALIQAKAPGVTTGELADQLLPAASVPSPAKVLGAQREAEARLALLQEFSAYSSEEIGRSRSKAANVHALASRWRAEGKVFSVDFHGRQLFPGFQFDAAVAPRPIVAEVLAALPRDEMSDWETALWWVAANEWLDGERPVDRIEENQALIDAAAHMAEPSAL